MHKLRKKFWQRFLLLILAFGLICFGTRVGKIYAEDPGENSNAPDYSWDAKTPEEQDASLRADLTPQELSTYDDLRANDRTPDEAFSVIRQDATNKDYLYTPSYPDNSRWQMSKYDQLRQDYDPQIAYNKVVEIAKDGSNIKKYNLENNPRFTDQDRADFDKLVGSGQFQFTPEKAYELIEKNAIERAQYSQEAVAREAEHLSRIPADRDGFNEYYFAVSKGMKPADASEMVSEMVFQQDANNREKLSKTELKNYDLLRTGFGMTRPITTQEAFDKVMEQRDNQGNAP